MERETRRERLRRAWPPSPWAQWEDGERFGWSMSLAAWRGFLLPYRTAEYRGFDKDTLELDLGPWHWHAPELWRAIRGGPAVSDGAAEEE